MYQPLILPHPRVSQSPQGARRAMYQPLILPHPRVDHPIPADSPPQNLISWEQEERARNLRESGWAGLPPKYEHRCFGSGPNCQLTQAIFGANAEEWDQAIASEHPVSPNYGFYAFNERFSHKNRPGGRRLTAAQFVDLYSAVAYANSLGLVMNSHVCITWGLLGILDHTEAANTLTDRVIKPLRQWCKDHMGRDQLAWLYVHENGRTHGFHTHMILAIPNDLRIAFKGWLKNRLSALCREGSMPKEAFHINAYPSDRIGRQWRHFQYLTKGIDGSDELSACVGWHSHVPVGRLINAPLENPGDVQCRKKCGVSNLIGVKARQRAGFRSLLEHGVTDVRRLYAGSEYLDHLRRTNLPMGDPVVRRLLQIEEGVLAIVDHEAATREHNEKQRRQSRRARRIAINDAALLQAKAEDFVKEETARREQILRLFNL